MKVNNFISDWNRIHTSSPSFQNAIEWARKTTIEKACKWLKEQVYQEYGGGPLERLIPDTMIEKFRNAMEE